MAYNICCFARITYAHEIKGGMEIQTLVLSEGLVKRGHRVTILTTSLEPMKELVRNENGVEIHYLPVPLPGCYCKEYWHRSVEAFRRLHEKTPFDIVWNESGGAIGYVKKVNRKHRVPMFTFLQGCVQASLVNAFRSSHSTRQVLRVLLQTIPRYFVVYMTWELPVLLASDMVICPSPQLAKQVRREALIPWSKLFVSVNGIDVNLFRPDDGMREQGRALLGLGPDDFLVLNVGRVTQEKGIHIMLRALARCVHQIPYLVVGIVGGGPYRENLESLAQELSLQERVRFLGIIPNEELPVYYNACDLSICPTLCIESYGISNAEAMACGKPVISSASGGTRYVIEDEVSGILVPPGKVSPLADAILRVHSNPDMASRLGRNARRRAVEHLSSKRMIDDVEFVISNILKRSR